MPEASPDGGVTKIIGPLVAAAIAGFLKWLTGAWPEWLSSGLTIAGAVCAFVFTLMYQRYLGVLAAGVEPEGTLEREAYDKLRDSLATENLAARLYKRWLNKLLDKVDRFFGDAEMADRTLFPHAFGLQTPWPLWTAPSFDRCLLLALLYPIAAIYLIWVMSWPRRSG
jgi:hypothetical protein